MTGDTIWKRERHPRNEVVRITTRTEEREVAGQGCIAA